jgi:hypothetical protein
MRVTTSRVLRHARAMRHHRAVPDEPAAVIQLPTFYVDAVQVSRQPFTVQVLLGKLDMVGEVHPSLHLTLSPGFCQRLGEILLEAAAGAREAGADEAR